MWTSSPSASSTRARLPNSVIFLRSRNSCKVHLLCSGTLYSLLAADLFHFTTFSRQKKLLQQYLTQSGQDTDVSGPQSDWGSGLVREDKSA